MRDLAFFGVLVVSACTQAYDPPKVFDEIFAHGTSSEVASGSFGGLKDIVALNEAENGRGLPARVLWTHGMCTPTLGSAPTSWWEIRTNDLLAAYPGSQLVPNSVVTEALPNGASLIKEALRTPGTMNSATTVELWFLDWTALTAPYKLTGVHDPESPPGNPYRYSRAGLNDSLKQGLIKDCFADVVVYLGKNGDPIRRDTQFALCEFFGGQLNSETGCVGASASRATMLVSESLGSSILFDGFRSLKFDYVHAPQPAAALTAPQARRSRRPLRAEVNAGILRRNNAALQSQANSHDMTSAMTSLTNFFMLANQIPLVGLAGGPSPGEIVRNESLDQFIASATEMRTGGAKPLTIVAFVDPNDLLSFRLIPKSDRARIVNFVVSNAETYLDYAARPDEAHCNYVRNGYVMHAIVFGYAGGAPEIGPVDDPEPCLGNSSKADRSGR
jgi:hypothetical protein